MVQKFAVIVICSHHVRMWAMKTHIFLLYFTVLMYTDFVRGVKLYVVDKNIGNDNTGNNIDNNANRVHCPFYRVPEYEVSLHSKPASAWNLDYFGTLPRNTSCTAKEKQTKLPAGGVPDMMKMAFLEMGYTGQTPWRYLRLCKFHYYS